MIKSPSPPLPVLDRDHFRRWLVYRDHREAGKSCSYCGCPLGRHLGPGWCIGENGAWGPKAEFLELPTWARAFTASMDVAYPRLSPVSGVEALVVLDSIPTEGAEL